MRASPTTAVESIRDVLRLSGVENVSGVAGEGGDEEEDGDGAAGDGEVAGAEEA